MVIKDYRDSGWINWILGLVGHTSFLVGSLLFFSENRETVGTWLFVTGSSTMLTGLLAELLVWLEQKGDIKL